MKKLALVLLMAAMPVLATTTPIERDAPNIRDKQMAYLVAEYVRLNGYRCDTISAFRDTLIGRGFVIHCNDYRYEYTLRDVGGNWVVEVD